MTDKPRHPREPGSSAEDGSSLSAEAARDAVFEVYLEEALGATERPRLTERIVAAAKTEGLTAPPPAGLGAERTSQLSSSSGSTEHPAAERKRTMSDDQTRRSMQGSAKSQVGAKRGTEHGTSKQDSQKSKQGSQKSKQGGQKSAQGSSSQKSRQGGQKSALGGSQKSKQGSAKSRQGSAPSKQGSAKSKQGSVKSQFGVETSKSKHGSQKSKQGTAATRASTTGRRASEGYSPGGSGKSAAPQQPDTNSRQTMLMIGSAIGVVALAVTIALIIAASTRDSESESDLVATNGDQENDSAANGNGEEEEEPPPVEVFDPLEVVAPDESLFGERGVNLEVALAAEGGKAPYRWQVSRTTPLPRGVELSVEGVLHGAPRYRGTYEFDVLCTDARGTRVSRSFEIRVDERLEIYFLGDPPDPILGEEYRFQLQADGGAEPYTWELAVDNLPRNLDFDTETGTLVGVPAEIRRFRFEVRLIDSVGRVAEREMFLEVLDIAHGGMTGLAPEPPPLEDMPETDWDEIVVPEPLGEEATGFRPPDRDEMERVRELNREAVELMQTSQFARAAELLREAIEIYPYDYTALYNLACAYAQLGETRQAIEMLRKAIENGFSDFNHIRADSDLDPIRDEPEFIALVEDPAQLQRAAANRTVQAMREEFPDYLVVADHDNRFIMATNQSRAVLQMLVERIENFSSVIWRELDWYRPDHYIEIILPSAEDFRAIAARRGAPPGVAGWYSPRERRLYNRTIGHVLTHEFLHALHFADLAHRRQQHHIWFIEGLATLFEDSRLPQNPDDTIAPFHSVRMRYAKHLQGREDRWSWRELFRMQQREFMPNTHVALINYGTARYICFWLWELGKLNEYYHLYCETFNQDGLDGRSGIVAMEQMFGKSLEEIEADWRAWLLALDDPPRQNTAWLGIHRDMEQDETGIRIGEVVAGSPADEAGMRPGDVIVEIDGRAVDNPHNLVQALSAFNPGDTVPIVVVRSEQDSAGRWRREPITKAVRLDDRGRRR